MSTLAAPPLQGASSSLIVTVADATKIVLATAGRLSSITVPLQQALGSILAEDLCASDPLPPYPASIKVCVSRLILHCLSRFFYEGHSSLRKFSQSRGFCGAFRTSSQVALVSSILPDDDAYMGVRDWPVMVKLKFVVCVGWVCRCCGRWGRGVSSGGRGESWRRCCCFAPSTWHCCLYHNRGCVTAVPSLCSSSALHLLQVFRVIRVSIGPWKACSIQEKILLFSPG